MEVDASSTRQKRLARLLVAYSILYIGFGLFILFLEKPLIAFMNFLQSLIHIGHPMSVPVEPFWKFVSISLLWMLGILCWWAKEDVAANTKLIRLMIYCKFFSAFLMLLWFFLAGLVTPYLFGGLTDLSLGIIALVYFLRAFPGAFRDFIRFSP